MRQRFWDSWRFNQDENLLFVMQIQRNVRFEDCRTGRSIYFRGFSFAKRAEETLLGKIKERF